MVKISYEKAVDDVGLRQDFLNQFFKENRNKAVSGLIYDEKLEKVKEYFDKRLERGEINEENHKELLESLKDDGSGGFATIAFCPRGPIGTGISSPIFVMSDCFSLPYEDFFSVIVDHEYVHAENVKLGLKFKPGLEYDSLPGLSFDPDVVLDLDESIAYCRTLNSAIKRKNRSDQIEVSIEVLEQITGRLGKIKKFSSVAEEACVEFQIGKNREVLKEIKKLFPKGS